MTNRIIVALLIVFAVAIATSAQENAADTVDSQCFVITLNEDDTSTESDADDGVQVQVVVDENGNVTMQAVRITVFSINPARINEEEIQVFSFKGEIEGDAEEDGAFWQSESGEEHTIIIEGAESIEDLEVDSIFMPDLENCTEVSLEDINWTELGSESSN